MSYIEVTKRKKDYILVDPTKSYRTSIEPEDIHIHILSESANGKNIHVMGPRLVAELTINQTSMDTGQDMFIYHMITLKFAFVQKYIWEFVGWFSNLNKIRATYNFLDNLHIEHTSWKKDSNGLRDKSESVLNIIKKFSNGVRDNDFPDLDKLYSYYYNVNPFIISFYII